MSVQKYKPSYENGILSRQSKPYTQILNKVLQECTNMKALALWCYLQSKPENWELNPKQIQNHFGIGKNQVYELLNYLITTKLLIRNRIINADGTYGETSYIICNGDEFVDNKEENLSTDPLPCFPELGFPELEKGDYINKRINTKKRLKQNKEKSFCAKTEKPKAKRAITTVKAMREQNEKRHDFAVSKDQNACEARHNKAHDERKAIEMTAKRTGEAYAAINHMAEWVSPRNIRRD